MVEGRKGRPRIYFGSSGARDIGRKFHGLGKEAHICSE